MFSVNIDKIINMTSAEADSYSEIMDNIYDNLNEDVKMLAITGDGIAAFKLASEIMAFDKKILFIDGNFDTDIFLGKYKLGKTLQGLAELVKGEAEYEELRCVTNRKDMDIIFTGTSDEYIHNLMPGLKAKLGKDMDKYDMIVVWSDEQGETAAFCDSTIAIIDSDEYSEEAASKKVNELEKKGCKVLGVIINEL